MVYRSARFSYVFRSLEESKRSIWDLDWSSDCGQRLDGFMMDGRQSKKPGVAGVIASCDVASCHQRCLLLGCSTYLGRELTLPTW